jgi:hypothetical protein
MKLPDVAKRMREIAEVIQNDYPQEAAELFELAAEIKRRSGTRAPASSTPIILSFPRKFANTPKPTPSCHIKT